jgi:hypothetical protein
MYLLVDRDGSLLVVAAEAEVRVVKHMANAKTRESRRATMDEFFSFFIINSPF